MHVECLESFTIRFEDSLKVLRTAVAMELGLKICRRRWLEVSLKLSVWLITGGVE